MLLVDKMLVVSVKLLTAKEEGAWNFTAVMFKKEAVWQYQRVGEEAARGTDDTQTQSSIKGNQQSEENE